jgi:hypothetical protein
MILCVGGDIHGALDQFYGNVLAFEAALGVRFEAVLHVGDFGIWPNPMHVDPATRDHEGAGDFHLWFAEGRAAQRPTVFIKGNHEDFVWLDEHKGKEILPGLTYLPNGDTIDLGERGTSIRVGGLGGCHGPSDYERPARQLYGYDRRHFTRDEVEHLSGRAGIDILLLHDAPAGVEFVQKRRDGRTRRYVSNAVGLADVIVRTHPRVCFFGHHHMRVDADIAGVRCVGLNLVGHPGNLVAVEIEGRGWKMLCEWPKTA